MKLFQFLISTLLVTASFFASAASPKTLNISSGEWAPYTGNDLVGKGIVPKIATEAFAEEGIKIDYDFISWSRAMDQAKQVKYDATLAWYDNEERRESFLFTDPILFDDIHFFHLKKNNFDWSQFLDLRNINIGVNRAFFYGDRFGKLASSGLIKVEKTNDDINNIKKLLRERIDITPISIFVGKETIKQNFSRQEGDSITVHPTPLMSSPLHILISKEHPKAQDIVDAFNKGLKKLKKSGRYEVLINESLKN